MHRTLPPSGFGVKLRELRLARGLTQIALAEQAGVHHRTVVKVERSEREPQWPTVLALAEALGVKVEVFVPKRAKPQGRGRKVNGSKR
jgi:transcriptional regulator with XRE-family HTH domain